MTKRNHAQDDEIPRHYFSSSKVFKPENIFGANEPFLQVPNTSTD